MKTHRLEDFTRGWLIGDFEPSIMRSKDFEFMVYSYRAGETEERHVHKIAREVTVIVSGRFVMNGHEVTAGDIVELAPGEDTDFVCLEDGTTAVIKTPSIIGDKYLM